MWLLLLSAATVAVSGQEFFPSYQSFAGRPYTVTYDKRSIRLNDSPAFFFSGSIHPPRSLPGEWDSILRRARSNGLNMIEVYVFWNFHEPVEGEYTWTGNADLNRFLQLCADNNLFVNLRIGPYVCAEWEYGGIPVWLALKEGVEFRTSNAVWEKYMELWMETVVNKTRSFFADMGGPIVLAQIENELSGAPQSYIDWCGNLAAKLMPSIPWVMCNGQSAANTINTCNDAECVRFIEGHGQNGRVLIDQPALWTENEGGFQAWGGSVYDPITYFWGRSIADLSFSIMQWIARGGSHMNYYMYYGGNNFDRWAGSGVTTMYAEDVPLCPDTLPHEPKFSHLGRLHSAVAGVAGALLNQTAQVNNQTHLEWYNPATDQWEIGTQQIAFFYGHVTFIESSASVPVLTRLAGTVFWMPPITTLLLVDGAVTFNSTDIQTTYKKRQLSLAADVPGAWWRAYTEPIPTEGIAPIPSWTATGPAEQQNATQGLDSILWYRRYLQLTAGDVALAWQGAHANGYTFFLNGTYIGEVSDADHNGQNNGVRDFKFKFNVVANGLYYLCILSDNLGTDNYPVSSGSLPKPKGITGYFKVNGVDQSDGLWEMIPSTVGQFNEIYTAEGSSKWKDQWNKGLGSLGPATWVQTSFFTPLGLGNDTVLLLRITPSFSRGYFFVNGYNLGRYWTLPERANQTRQTQTYYYIPTSILVSRESTNLLTYFDINGQKGGDIMHQKLYYSYLGAGIPDPDHLFDVVDCGM